MTSRRFCTFAVGGLLLAVDVARIEEVLWAGALTTVPLADPSVAGLLNLRGEIVTVVDARKRFGLPPRGVTGGVHVILRRDGEPVGLLVDAEGDVLEVDDDAWDDVPGTVGAAIRTRTLGAHLHEERLLLELDPDSVLALATT